MNFLRNAREWATPQLRESAFLERGVLTPEEFVAAGDQLVYRCPTWQWEGGDPSRRRPYLPADKQFLVTRRVPCRHRVASLMGATYDEVLVADEGSGGGDSGWVATHIKPAAAEAGGQSIASGGGGGGGDVGGVSGGRVAHVDGGDDDELEVIGGGGGGGMAALSIGLAPGSVSSGTVCAAGGVSVVGAANGGCSGGGGGGGDATSSAVVPEVEVDVEDEDYEDLAEYEEEWLETADDATAAASPSTTATTAAAASASASLSKNACAGNAAVVKTRTYDLSITYDKYYQTPRVWLFGYSERNQPLTEEQIFEDVMQDYAQRTVTMDPHPHLGTLHASVHPCKHANVMATIVRSLGSGGNEPRTAQYMFIFLKFIGSVVPTIEHDFTMAMQGKNDATVAAADNTSV